MMPDFLGFASTLVDKFWPDATSAAEAKLKLMQLHQSGELQRIAEASKIIQAEASSADKWTSRARPSFMYVMYLLFLLCMIGAIVGVWYPLQMEQAAKNLKLLFSAIPNDLYWLFGTGYLGYTGMRTFEKTKGVAK